MQKLLLQLSYGEESYLPLVKPLLLGKANVSLNNQSPSTVMEVAMRAKEKGTTQVATTSEKLLHLLLGKGGTLNDYAGSIIEKFGVEFLILRPLEHLVTVPFGRFLFTRYLGKFLHKEDWLQLPAFQWELFTPNIGDSILRVFAEATFIAIDIETGRDTDRRITCVGFSAVCISSDTNSFTVRTIVVPFDSSYNVAFAATLCLLPAPKVFQNGKYDNSYLLRYGIAVSNYSFDTINLFHSWYTELPKDLAFIVGFTLRRWQFWKDESKTQDLQEYYAYNAKDAFTTAMSFLAILQEIPSWALENYKKEFPVVLPCLLAEMTGIKPDKQRMAAEEVKFNEKLATQLSVLRTLVGNANYNPSSPQQTLRLFEVLGSSDMKNTKPAARDKVAARHPLNKRLVTAIQKYREDRKLLTSYLRDYDPKKDKYKIWNDRIYFALNPHGTDTGRLASKESHFWCGYQFQNIPEEFKAFIISDNDFLFGEGDYEQAEARDTAYLSGDTALIAAVESTRDFHASNATRFFGREYETIVDDNGKVIDKELRDLAKRVNHGSNYNMGAGVLLDTMGMEKMAQARALLKLPRTLTLKQVAQSLLNTYEKSYPAVKGAWYDKVKSDVKGSQFLVGPTGWTRLCFGRPDINKRDLNAYVAHPPQSLNAMTLNKAYMLVFTQIAMQNIGNFKLGPQIHDSILFQYRRGYEHLAWEVKKCMEMVIPVKDSFGITRELFVPVALKGGATVWSEIRKLER